MGRSQAVQTAQVGAAPFFAGKNKIINGDFYWNQRGFSSTTTNGTFGFDRWFLSASGGTSTYSAETFTAGTAPVAGYEGKTFARVATSGQSAASTLTILRHRIESARTLAGQTATISFWAKASSGTPKVAVESGQNFGTGGSPSTGTEIYFGQVTLSTSWTRYTLTASIPAITSVTFGTNNNDYLAISFWTSAGSDYNARTGSLGIQTATIDFWGVQIEAGSVATAFQTATGTLAGELAACQRYYYRTGGDSLYQYLGTGAFLGVNSGFALVNNPVTMRVAPTSIDFSTLQVYDYGTPYTLTNLTLLSAGKTATLVETTQSGSGTVYRPYLLRTNNSLSAYVGFNAEL